MVHIGNYEGKSLAGKGNRAEGMLNEHDWLVRVHEADPDDPDTNVP
jgi:hypothetical protein